MTARPRSLKVLLCLLASVVLLTIPFHLRPDRFIVDDGYFYPQIARFIAHGQGSTFNGVMLTNGYHPLWMLVCVAAALVTSSSSSLLQILGTVQDLLLLACIATLFFIARAAKMRGAILGAVPLVFFATVLGIWRLLETNLALTLQIACLVLAVPVLPAIYAKLGRWRDALLGILLGLTMLARLDLLFFVFIVLVYQLFERNSSSITAKVMRIALQAILAGALVVPYLLWNCRHFHHLVTISGAIKSSFPHLQHWGLQSFLYPVVVAILLNGFLLFRSSRSPFQSICLISAAGAALHLAYSLSYGEIAPWYLTTGYLTVSLTIIWTVDLILRKAPSIARLEPILAGLIFAMFFILSALRVVSNFSYTHLRTGRVVFSSSYVEAKRALAMKLSETLPAGSRMFIFDAPGGVAFHSGMNILPVDGLVLDFDYNHDIVQQGVARYAADKHVDYFIAPWLQPNQIYDRLDLREVRSGDAQIMTLKAPLIRQTVGGPLTLHDSDLVFRFREINPDLEAAFPEIGIWRIPHLNSQP